VVLDELPLVKGLVVTIKANYSIVEIDLNQSQPFSHNGLVGLNNLRFLCTLRKRLTHRGFSVRVGDRVVLESIDMNAFTAVISNLEPRESLLSRPPVANVTEVFVVLSVKSPSFDFDQASRFLLTAEKSGLSVYLILTKTDLINAEDLDNVIKRLTNWGYTPIAVSVKNGQGMELLTRKLKRSQLAVLCGPSGAGKSSILNHLLPNESISIGDLSGKLQRGRHTTRNVELYALDKGSFIADTPGFNRPDLKVRPVKLQTLFPELQDQVLNCSCRFRDCLHTDEPGCGVDTNWERYRQYRKLLGEMISLYP